MSLISPLKRKTLRYKTTQQGLDIHIEVWAPPNFESGPTIHHRPAFLYFHGGGFAVGARDVWIPEWAFNRLTERGYLFISADYRFLPACTAYDIVEDIKDIWALITSPDLDLTFGSEAGQTTAFKIDANAIAVGGSSAGGLCATLAALHCKNPKPTAILSVYGVGGQIFTSYYLSPKKDMFVHSLEYLDFKDFEKYVYPFTQGKVPEVAHSLPEYVTDHPLGPSYPANVRMQLIWLYLQNGVALDYLTGQHSPSISATLRDTCGLGEPAGNSPSAVVVATPELQKEGGKKIDWQHLRTIFPQFNISSDWPAMVFIHGTSDTGVPIVDSEHLHNLLNNVGVPSKIYRVEGQEHAFDYAPDAESKWGTEFEGAIEFVHKYTTVKGQEFGVSTAS